MKILITGANGQLGRSLQRVLPARFPSSEIICTDIDTLDLTDYDAVDAFVGREKPDFILNCAAYTAVDRAEEDGIAAHHGNVEAPAHVAASARKHGAKLVHISTDYVFNGENFQPYVENDEPRPRSIYGRTKLEGEGVVSSFAPDSVIIRTAWLYSEFGHNFVRTMLGKAEEGASLKVVGDQIGSPTYAGDLAEAIAAILDHPQWHPGIYHYTNEGVASWYDFAKAVMDLSGHPEADLRPCQTSEYPTPATRPPYSVLSKAKIKRTFGIEIPHWRDSLAAVLRTLIPNS